MGQALQEITSLTAAENFPSARVVFTMGGKGGCGKSSFASMLTEWYKSKGIDIGLVDTDSENKAQGSLQHFFGEARKTNIQRSRGLDDFLDMIDGGATIVVADQGIVDYRIKRVH